VESGHVVGGNPARIIRTVPAHTGGHAGNGKAAIDKTAIHQEEKGESMA
jgi:virginiamycin A acetyltransferase